MNPKTCVTKIKGNSVAFIHIPKTGGQSIQKALGMGLRRHLPVTDKLRKRELLTCAFAFAFVREPLQRAESLFYWLATLHLRNIKRRPENAALNQWARNTNVNDFWQNVDVSYLNRQLTGNMFRTQTWFLQRHDESVHPRIRICKFEKMEEEWGFITNTLGIDRKLPHTNKSSIGYFPREAMSAKTKDAIRSLYGVDYLNFYPTEK